MKIEIRTRRFQLEIYGFGGISSNKNYVNTAFLLSGKMWEIVKTNNIKNKGINIWVYEDHDKVFAGVELENPMDAINFGLDKKEIKMEKYAYYKHVGPYKLISQIYQQIKEDIIKLGLELKFPYIEIYGHWTKDENQLETELLMNLK